MAKNVIIMIGDGMGWEMTRASAVQAQIEAEIAQIRESNPIFCQLCLRSNLRHRSIWGHKVERAKFP